ncbi:hypothetical protein WMF39_12010 [Sorangium sp. So ce1504]|uniref:hypothetical protein n=1 Tax=Sorangium sp. So ce1504 TaxID=3133337 RepID=UPI003F637D91
MTTTVDELDPTHTYVDLSVRRMTVTGLARSTTLETGVVAVGDEVKITTCGSSERGERRRTLCASA